MSESIKSILDTILNKFVSRKLLVFLICTIALFWDKIEGKEWVNVAMIYVGTQAVIDAIVKLRAK